MPSHLSSDTFAHRQSDAYPNLFHATLFITGKDTNKWLVNYIMVHPYYEILSGDGKNKNKETHHVWIWNYFQFTWVTQSCPTLCDPMNRNTPDLPVHHQLPEFTQTHVHWVGDTIQPSHPLSSPSPPAFNLSQHQGLFKWVSSSHQVAKVLEFQLQHQSFQWTPRTGLR